MAPVEWLCELCTEILLDPVTLPCCGESFCQECLRQWTITKLEDGAQRPRCPAGCGKKIDYRLPQTSKCLRQWTITKLEDGAQRPRCPAGCGKKIDYRLPQTSKVLRQLLESSHSAEIAERRGEAEDVTPLLGGFEAWQEDIVVGDQVYVSFGTSGVVLCNHETTHVKVKFDSVLHGTGTLNVFPAQLMPQLPRSRSACGSEQRALQIGEAVVAALNLTTGEPPVVAVPFGTPGTIVGAAVEGRIEVLFTSSSGPKRLNVQRFEIETAGELLGEG
eukprot:g31970.t2